MGSMQRLKDEIGKYDSAVIAYSGGVDSSFLASVAHEVLGDKLLLVIAQSSTYPSKEKDEAVKLAEQLGIEYMLIASEETDIAEFVNNPPDRCYYCKKELFTKIAAIAKERDASIVFDGSNKDDLGDYRPGRRALGELGIVSPLVEAGLGKEEIRRLSKKRGLPTWDKPAYACLASRFPYGEEISPSRLERVDKAEQGIRELGFRQFRVRSHGDCARIEFLPEDLDKGWAARREVTRVCKDTGFVHVAIDSQGYRMGAMNEALNL